MIARTTAFTFKGKEIDPQAVGRQWASTLCCPAEARNRAIRSTFKPILAKASDRSQLWGEHFGGIADVQSLQADIAGD